MRKIVLFPQDHALQSGTDLVYLPLTSPSRPDERLSPSDRGRTALRCVTSGKKPRKTTLNWRILFDA